MDLWGLESDSRGVSEVMGEILMIGIVVILAAVTAGQLFGIWADLGVIGPKASVSITDASDSYPTHAFSIEHQGGDRLDADELKIVIRDAGSQSRNATLTASGGGFAGDGVSAYQNDWSTPFTTELETGDGLNIDGSASDRLTPNTRYEVVVIHVPSGESIASNTVLLK